MFRGADYESLVKGLEASLEAELRKIAPGAKVKVVFPHVIIVFPAENIISDVTAKLKSQFETEKALRIEKIEWDMDGLRIYFKIVIEA